MPIPIASLFDEDDNIHCQPSHKDIKKISKGWPTIPIKLSDFPTVNPPEVYNQSHDEDLNTVKLCVLKPVNSKKFLKVADEEPFSIFTEFCRKNNLSPDIEKYERLNEELSSLVLSLKYKYNRPRPKKYMRVANDSFNHNRIGVMDTPSYPSGHTSHAFFNATLLANEYPEHAISIRTIAEMIAQSRIDLGKHYPSDCSFGRFVGETAAKACLAGGGGNHIKLKENKLSTEQRRQSRQAFYDAANLHDEKLYGTSYTDELCEFIIRSNAIERYSVDIDDALNASSSFMKGLPVQYCSDDKYILSHLAGLETAGLLNRIDTPLKVQQVHSALGLNVLERGEPGKFRDFEHLARSTGYQYSHPNIILSDVSKWCDMKYDDKFMRHVAYECIHPFSDGNGRSGRLILAADLNFNMAKLNDMIDDNYIPRIVEYQEAYLK